MNPQQRLKLGFWEDMVPISLAWTVAMVLTAAGLVLIVGVFTAPLGILLILWAGRIAGKSFVKHWSKAYDRRLEGERDSAC